MAKKKGKVKKKEGLRLKNREFWIFIAVIFLLSVLTILNFIGNSGVTGHASFVSGKHVQTIAYMKEGQLDFEIRNIDGLSEATLQLVETVKGGKIFFEEDDSISFDRNFYSKFKVSSTEEDKYRGLRLQLKIKESDLLDSGISKGDLRLFVNNKELPTTFFKKENEYLYYKATTFEFGDCVLGKAVPVMVVEDSVKETAAEEPVASEEELDQVQEETKKEALAGRTGSIPEEKGSFGSRLVIIIMLVIVAAVVITIFIGKRKKK